MTDVTNPLAEAVIVAEVVEVAATGAGPAVSPAKKRAGRQMPKWESETRDRVRTLSGASQAAG